MNNKKTSFVPGKIFLWDVDGVLIWHHPTDPAQDWRVRLIERGWLSPWEAFQKSPDWQECLQGKTGSTSSHFKKFLARNNFDPDLADGIISIWLKENTMPHAPGLEKLRSLIAEGFQCAIASNQDPLRAVWLETWLDRQNLNIPRFISCHMGHAKPDIKFFHIIKDHWSHLNEPEFYFIDDHLRNVDAAQKCGWNVIHYTGQTPIIWPRKQEDFLS